MFLAHLVALYVLGGINDGFERNESSVECYDPAENKWIEKTIIPVKILRISICKGENYSFTGCVLKLSEGVLDKLEVVKPAKVNRIPVLQMFCQMIDCFHVVRENEISVDTT